MFESERPRFNRHLPGTVAGTYQKSFNEMRTPGAYSTLLVAAEPILKDALDENDLEDLGWTRNKNRFEGLEAVIERLAETGNFYLLYAGTAPEDETRRFVRGNSDWLLFGCLMILGAPMDVPETTIEDWDQVVYLAEVQNDPNGPIWDWTEVPSSLVHLIVELAEPRTGADS